MNIGDQIITIKQIIPIMPPNKGIEKGTIGIIVRNNFGIYNWIVRTENNIEFECGDYEIKLFESTVIKSDGFGYIYNVERNISL